MAKAGLSLCYVVLVALLTASCVRAVAAPQSDSKPQTADRAFKGTAPKNVEYEGRFEGTPKGLLRIDVRQDRRGRPVRGLFQPKRIVTNCVGGTTPFGTFDLGSIPIYFHGHGRFEGQFYATFPNGFHNVVLVRGRLDENGPNAAGDIVVLINPRQASGQPYCSTGGRRDWKARRLR